MVRRKLRFVAGAGLVSGSIATTLRETEFPH